jgi:repressor of nif and glnA expression
MNGYEKRNPGQHITLETRSESEQEVDKQKRYRQIIEILTENKEPMTAKEIAVAMFKKHLISSSERNFAAPRLTELSKKGIVDTLGKKRCKYTNKSVTVYGLR